MAKETKQTITLGEAVRLNTALNNVKVAGLERKQTIDYLNLKIALGDIAKQYGEHDKKVMDEVAKQYGLKEGDKLEGEVKLKFETTYYEMLSEYAKGDSGIDPHVLSEEEVFNAILNLDLNNSIGTGDKALILKMLVK